MPQIVSTPDAVPRLPPLLVFSQATISGGHVYCSGSIGCSKDHVVVAGGVQAETRAALENMAAVLRAAGSGLQHVLKANVYLTDMARDFAPMNVVYLKFFEKDRKPARTGVGVVCFAAGRVCGD